MPILLLCCLAVTANANETYNWQTELSVFQIGKAVHSSSTEKAKTLRTAWKRHDLQYRFLKPQSIKILAKGEHGLVIEMFYSSGFVQYATSGMSRLFKKPPDLIEEKKWEVVSAAEEDPVTVGYWGGRRIVLHNFFRVGQGDEEFNLALKMTVKRAICDQNPQSAFSETTLNACLGFSQIRDHLDMLPTWSPHRRYDIRELPLPIQAEIRNAVELYSVSMEWWFLLDASQLLN